MFLKDGAIAVKLICIDVPIIEMGLNKFLRCNESTCESNFARNGEDRIE